MREIFFLLFPPEKTLEDELCKCEVIYKVKLMSSLNYNPIYCTKCNLEVSPEKLNLDDLCISSIAEWLNLYNSLYRLWLDSEYEKFAFDELRNLNSRVNKIGLYTNKLINKFIESYYFYQIEDIPKICPICENELNVLDINNDLSCSNCMILFSLI